MDIWHSFYILSVQNDQTHMDNRTDFSFRFNVGRPLSLRVCLEFTIFPYLVPFYRGLFY